MQAEILNATWAHLKPGGAFVIQQPVLSCQRRMRSKSAAFLARTPDAVLSDTGTPEQPGQQNLPGAEEGDGFFYAKLIKK
ncbi:hypothetical protein ACLK1Y_18195 [Escherichia coli]